MLNLVLFGPPGAGKGTQSNLLIDKYNLVHLSTGDILRGEIEAGTALGLEAKALMDRGDLVPDEVVIGMISSKLNNNPSANGFIFDGFPRTAAQAEALDNLLEDKGTAISVMLSLKAEDDELIWVGSDPSKNLHTENLRINPRTLEIVERKVLVYTTESLAAKNAAAYFKDSDPAMSKAYSQTAEEGAQVGFIFGARTDSTNRKITT